MSSDLAKAAELAQKLGYLSPGPIVYVGDATTPEARAELQNAGYNLIDVDARGRSPRLERDEYGRPQYVPARSTVTPISAAASLSLSVTGSPPAIMEQPPIFASNMAIQVDRFALNPGEVLFRALLPGAEFISAAPTMFATGDLPPLTGSGVDPAILRWCPWYLRHSAALASSRAQLLMIIEESFDGAPDYQRLQSVEGQDHLQAYLSRISGWAQTPPPDAESLTDLDPDEIARRFYPPGPSDD